jgi:hypothetical protein
MQRTKRTMLIGGILLFGLTVFAVGIHAAFKGNSLGFDYMFFWNAGRALFVEGASPYSPEVIQRIQVAIYGRLALPGEYPYPFPYPLPILFVPFPLFFLSYDWSQAAWMAINLLVPVSVGLLLFTRAPKWLALTLPLFYQMVFTWIVGNYALLIGVIIIVVFYDLLSVERHSGWADFFCGLALAWVTNKPQMVWLFVCLALLVALRDRRWKLIAGFAAGLAGFHLIGLILVPDWPAQWLNIVRLYPQQSGHVPSLVAYLEYLLPSSTAWTVSAVLALLLLALTIWFFRRWWQGNLPGLLLLAWCGLITSLVDLSALTPDQIILLVPVFLWAIHRPPTKWLMIGWFSAIAITYLFFFLSLYRILPVAVDRGPLLVYVVWLVWVWRSGINLRLGPLPALESGG